MDGAADSAIEPAAPPSAADEALERYNALRARVDSLANLTMDKMFKVMETGTPRDQLTVAKTVLPLLIRVIGEEQQADDLADLREEMRAMHGAMRESIAKRTPDTRALPDIDGEVISDDADIPEG